MKLPVKFILVFLLLWTILLLVTFNRHIKRKPFTYTSEIYADKAGYYVYLPATFIYHWDGTLMPDSIPAKIGNSFQLQGDKITTKYPMGTAIMLAPFWLVNHYFIAGSKDGFSFSYTLISPVAATFYVLLGLFISYFCFKKFTTHVHSILLTALLFFGTNLFYYTVLETGMSHSFSFLWFSSLLYLILKIKDQQYLQTSDAILLGVTLGAILLIRPINALFCLPYFLLLFIGNKNFVSTFTSLFLSGKSIIVYILPIVLYSPQLYYYTIAPAHSFKGFVYVSAPKILEVLFSPENGMLLYTPILIFLIIYYLSVTKKYAPYTIPALLLISSVVCLYSMWWSYELGCALGHRSIVEFYTILFLPLSVISMSDKLKTLFISVCVICIVYNLKLSFTYDECFGGSGDWDWQTYLSLLLSNIK